MKKAPLIALFFAAALMTLSGCGKITPDRPIPQPKDPEPEKPEDPKVPEEPEEPAGMDFIDVETAFKQMHLVSFVQSCNHYSPHSGVDVTEFRYNDYVANPQAVFVMQVDLSDETVSMTNTVPGDAKTSFNAGRETLTGQFKRIDMATHWVIGGTNTDFFAMDGSSPGTPQGAFWHNGNCLKNTFNSQATRPRCFVYWGDDEQVHMAKSAEYSTVKARGGFRELFSGGQFLVENGKATNYVEDSVYGVHPRTMFGVCKDNRHVVLVVIDGRNNTLAIGMNYPDMQKILLSLGCETALNIDGGGSSTFVVRNESFSGYGQSASFTVRNKPSDGSQRKIGPGLAIVASD